MFSLVSGVKGLLILGVEVPEVACMKITILTIEAPTVLD